MDSKEDVKSVSSSLIKHVVLGGAIAFVVAYIIAFLFVITDTKIYDESTVKDNFEQPIIGIIPEWDSDGTGRSKRKKHQYRSHSERNYEGKLIGDKTPFGVTEAFNTLRTNLCYSTPANDCPVFAITSDFSGAGKSIISTNIAISLAMLGKKTLLIECDLRRPVFNRIFGTKVKEGLSEYLSGVEKNVENVIKSSTYDELSIIYSGRIPPNPTELLGSEKMAELITECKSKFDMIIIDTPPAFEVSDVCVLSPLVHGSIIVAKSEFSDVNALKMAVELINGVNGKIVGFVVNDVDFKSTSAYKSKGYKYKIYRRYGRYGRYRRYGDYSKSIAEDVRDGKEK